MIRNYLPSKGKIELATERFNKILQWTVPTKSLVSDWIPIIGIEGNIHASDIFEHVYRCYHGSYKVLHMQGSVGNFRDMIVYLFCKRIDKRFLLQKRFDRLLGFPSPIEGIKLKDVFHKDTVTYKYVKDVSSCKEKGNDRDGCWQDWTDSHLTLMGGVFFSLIASISLLGMLQRYVKKDYKQPQLITYPDGVSSYILSSINYEGLNR